MIESTLGHLFQVNPCISGSPSTAAATTVRRTSIPARPAGEWQLVETLRSLIGQNLLTLPIPVQYNEPLSMLQRYSLHYSSVVDPDPNWTFIQDLCGSVFRIRIRIQAG